VSNFTVLGNYVGLLFRFLFAHGRDYTLTIDFVMTN
jgi:hypothetical protein